MTPLKYTLKTDTLFKMLFTKYQNLLKRLVSELLDMEYDDIEQFTVINPDISPLAGIVNLTWLDLVGNQITDWSPVDHIELVWGRPE